MRDESTARARAALTGRVRRGEYVVDTHAVADALLRHWEREGRSNAEERRRHPRFERMAPDDPDATPEGTTRISFVRKP